MYKVLIKIDGEYLYMLEAFENGSMDIISLLVIIYCISIAYRKRYSLTGYLYVKEQLNLLSAYCTVFAIVMYIYYYLEEKFHYDSKYMNGIILILFILIAGLLSRVCYEKYFANRLSKYQASDEDRMVLILAAFIAISIRLVASGVVKLVVPVSIVLGKFIWLDTESIEDIKKLVKTEHKRIIETAILLILGVLILSILVYWFNMPRYMHPLIALFYGMIIILKSDSNVK